jgi:WD40 repeat protein
VQAKLIWESEDKVAPPQPLVSNIESTALAISPDGRQVATALGSGDIQLRGADDGMPLVRLSAKPSSGAIHDLSFSPDSAHLAAVGIDGMVRVWRLSDQNLTEWNGEQGTLHAVALHPDAEMIATAGQDVKCWRLDGTLLLTLDQHSKPIRDLDFNRDGTLLVTASEDQTGLIWRPDRLTAYLGSLGLGP